ncbi:hypothetical protein B0181_01475 [Moraxella caviae]|uniref:DUF1850 domain-containing protein n=1 Tax=Moraxella caviae TaxID=34060 RepID=A0A1T0ABZ0_9GAMM|nr:hypothetical protein B0181_01475 [Moraxella caviae]
MARCVVIVACFFVVAVGVFWRTPAVVLRTPNDEFHCRLAHDFSLKWRHSVEKQLWQENYTQQGDKLLLTSTYIQSFGAGTPSTGTPISAPQGYTGQRVDLALDVLNWVVSDNMAGEIISADGRFAIAKKLPDYTEVQIKPATLNAWQRLWIAPCPAE